MVSIEDIAFIGLLYGRTWHTRKRTTRRSRNSDGWQRLFFGLFFLTISSLELGDFAMSLIGDLGDQEQVTHAEAVGASPRAGVVLIAALDRR